MKMNKKTIFIICLIALIGVLAFYLAHQDDYSKADCAKLITSENEFTLELAKNREQHMIGLMFRKQLNKNGGMIFIFDIDADRSFWMKNTYIPLDIIFVGEDKRIRKIYANVPAYREGMKESDIPVVSAQSRYVIELSSGMAENSKLKEGDKLNIKFLKKENCGI